MAGIPGSVLRAVALLTVALLAPVAVAALDLSDPVVGWVVAGAVVGAVLALRALRDAYAAWMRRSAPTRTVRGWVGLNLANAIGGIGVQCLAAAVMAAGSDANSAATVAAGVGAMFTGLVPVILVVHVDASDLEFTGGAGLARWQAWALNAALTAGSTVVPALVLTRGDRDGLVVGGVVWLLWFGALVVERFGRNLAVAVTGVAAVVATLTALSTVDPRRLRWEVLLAVPVGVALAAPRLAGTGTGSLAAAVGGPGRREIAGFGASVLLAVSAAGWVRVAGGLGPPLLLAVAVALVLVGASVVVGGKGVVALAVFGLLSVWVVQDHTVERRLDPPAPGAEHVLVAFGDSYMSGEGIGSFYAGTDTAGARSYLGGGSTRSSDDNECRRSPEAYVPRVAATHRLVPAFYACSGALAVSDAMVGVDPSDPVAVRAAEKRERTENSVYGQLLRFTDRYGSGPTLRLDPDMVLVSLGGNDAGFAKIGAACFLPGSCGAALAGADGSSMAEGGGEPLAEVTARARLVLDRVVAAFPDTPIAVIAYPQMFGPAVDECAGQVPFDGREIAVLRRFVERLNEAVGLAVAGVDESPAGARVLHLTRTTRAFDGAAFCMVDGGGVVEPVAMNALSFQPTEGAHLLDRLGPTKIIHNTFHPTAEGHRRLAAAVSAAIDDGCLTIPVVAGCRGEGELPPVAGTSDAATVATDARAPLGRCVDLATYQQCAILGALRATWPPIVGLFLAGLVLAGVLAVPARVGAGSATAGDGTAPTRGSGGGD